MTRNEIAKHIFEEIRDRPFRVATSVNEPADNCYFKCMELVKQLTTFGYSLRGRLGEIDWKKAPIPNDIIDLYPEGVIDTHFYLEIYLDHEWKILDPTWNKSFALRYELPYSEFGSDNQSCFQITKLYNLEKQTSYARNWLTDKKTIEQYTQKTGPFFSALNSWLEQVNP